MIPKIIHYCWFGQNPKPEDIKQFIETWHIYCPDYKIVEWNETNFDIKCNPYVFEAYKAKKWAFVSDFVRLKVLYDYGGFYMDTDVEVVRSLDPLRIYDAVSGYESTTAIPTGTMGAIAQNEWIKMLLEDYNDRHFFLPNGELDLTTNVERISKLTTKHYKVKLNGKRIAFGSNMVILPFDYLCAKDFETGIIHKTSRTFTIHHFKGSWLTDYDKYKDNLRRNLNKWIPSSFLTRKIAAYLATVKYEGVVKANHKLFDWIFHK